MAVIFAAVAVIINSNCGSENQKRHPSVKYIYHALIVSNALIVIYCSVVSSRKESFLKHRNQELWENIYSVIMQQHDIQKIPAQGTPKSKGDAIVNINRIDLIDRHNNQQKMLQKKESLTISNPVMGGYVDRMQLFDGNINIADAKVYLIVHPIGISAYWVQPKAIVDNSGEWQTHAYIGRPGNIDKGKSFEIMAISLPKDNLTEGQILYNWPEAKLKSAILDVVRK
ncbi:MAG: hypothetical protein HGB12_10795 [Bacteroidetes bacterium]|nr:hypothetical protein [Bacteroidota bacterium]